MNLGDHERRIVANLDHAAVSINVRNARVTSCVQRSAISNSDIRTLKGVICILSCKESNRRGAVIYNRGINLAGERRVGAFKDDVDSLSVFFGCFEINVAVDDHRTNVIFIACADIDVALLPIPLVVSTLISPLMTSLS